MKKRGSKHIQFETIKDAAISLARERGYDPFKPLLGQRLRGWDGGDQALDMMRHTRMGMSEHEPAWKGFWLTALARLKPKPNQPTYLVNNMPTPSIRRERAAE